MFLACVLMIFRVAFRVVSVPTPILHRHAFTTPDTTPDDTCIRPP